MAEEDRSHLAPQTPDQLLAAELVRRFSLEPPIDVRRVATEYADIELDFIPGDCSGLVVDLNRHAREKPLVLVERSDVVQRRRFTLAHELGHVLLPWHVGGAFLCDPAPAGFPQSDTYDLAAYRAGAAEREANRFAAELLLPSGWLNDQIARLGLDTIEPLFAELKRAVISAWVACLRLQSVLPPGHMFVIIEGADRVALAGQSRGTRVPQPRRGEKIHRRRLDRFATSTESFLFGSRRIDWWHFQGDVELAPEDDERTSREILAQLLEQHVSESEAHTVQLRLNGVIGSENSTARGEDDTAPHRLYVRFRSRFAQERVGIPDSLLDDPDFERWLRKRADDLAE